MYGILPGATLARLHPGESNVPARQVSPSCMPLKHTAGMPCMIQGSGDSGELKSSQRGVLDAYPSRVLDIDIMGEGAEPSLALQWPFKHAVYSTESNHQPRCVDLATAFPARDHANSGHFHTREEIKKKGHPTRMGKG